MESKPSIHELHTETQLALIERLRESEQRYASLVNSLQTIVFNVNSNGYIEFLNDTWVQLLGYPKTNCISSKITTFMLNPDTDEPFEWTDIMPLSSSPVCDRECKLITHTGELLWFSYSAQHSSDDGTISGTLVDMTLRKMAEQERESLSKARSNFFSSMSHDLRTPINGMVGTAELIMDSHEGSTHKYASTIKDSALHLLHIIDDILDYSKIEARELQLHENSFHLRNVINSIVNIFIPVAQQKAIELNLNIDEDAPQYIYSDEKRLRQILNNLINNALKFTAQGQVTVNISTSKIDGSYRLIAEIKDTGVGIPSDKLEELFKPFKQTDNSIQKNYGGTGLGLAITKELVDLMHGKIHVDSEFGVGATFTVELKISIPTDVPIVSSNITESNALNADNMSIMIVEDDRTCQMLLIALLTKHGFDKDYIKCAHSGEAMRSMLNGHSYDLVIMDCNLPDADGTTLIKEIRDYYTEADSPYIIASTASTGEREYQSMLEAGVDDFIPKPISKNSVANAMIRLANHKPSYPI